MSGNQQVQRRSDSAWAATSRVLVAAGIAFIATAVVLTWRDPPQPGAVQTSTSVATQPLTQIATPVEPVTPPPSTDAPVAATATPTVVPSPAEATPIGLMTFRGNATRTFYGTGPIGADASILWTYPGRSLCSESTVGEETKQWCGSGWTGQPSVFERDGRTWVVVGAYDRAVHFIDGDTGQAILPPFITGDIIKGSVSIDPDGYPIVYSGSRDGQYRAIAFDGEEPRELWSMSAADATGPTLWNDDWDGSGLIIDGHLVVGGENSRLFVARLDRSYDDDGRVSLSAEVISDVAGWDDELLHDLGDHNVSIEGSVAIHEGVVYFANSGGLVQGWDLGSLTASSRDPEQVFRWWMGDDVDASVVVDPETGDLIVAAEWERHTARSREVGQVVRLDPASPDQPVVWGMTDPAAQAGALVAGVWGTPAIWRDLVIVPTTSGMLFGLDALTGEVRWSLELGDHLWSSPVVVDDVLLQGTCGDGIHAFDLTVEDPPTPRWDIDLVGCVESTPAVWGGRLYVGTRSGQIVGIDLR
ncbi:MAG: PQQ-binding-like beta-propeller repeat protein [Euzebya sp.]